MKILAKKKKQCLQLKTGILKSRLNYYLNKWPSNLTMLIIIKKKQKKILKRNQKD